MEGFNLMRRDEDQLVCMDLDVIAQNIKTYPLEMLNQ